jgi:LuxR family transcriptional regulator, quorum-sensing system regulator SdiA
MRRHQRINHQLQRLVAERDWVFAVGLRIRFNHPTLLYQTYPEDWVAYYSQNGLLFTDPAVLWGMTNIGVCDWADLESKDHAGVLRQARDFGLVHGIAVSVGDSTSRSLGFFARSDQVVTPAQRALAEEVLADLHVASEGVADLPPAELAELAALNEGLSPARK